MKEAPESCQVLNLTQSILLLSEMIFILNSTMHKHDMNFMLKMQYLPVCAFMSLNTHPIPCTDKFACNLNMTIIYKLKLGLNPIKELLYNLWGSFMQLNTAPWLNDDERYHCTVSLINCGVETSDLSKRVTSYFSERAMAWTGNDVESWNTCHWTYTQNFLNKWQHIKYMTYPS